MIPSAKRLLTRRDFLRLIQMQKFLHYTQYLDETDEEIQTGLRRC